MPTVSTIRVTFEGMLLVFINADTLYCDVGFLKDVAHHEPGLLITRMPKDGAAEELLNLRGAAAFEEKLWLDVIRRHPEGPRVRLYKSAAPDPFQRVVTPGNRGDFRWAVDLEGHEVYERLLDVSVDKLRPILRINDGIFYSQTPLSYNELTRQRVNEPRPIPLGKVAIQLRAEINLEAGDEASFFNGSKLEPLPVVQDVDYGIYVSQKRHAGHDHDSIDAEHYHPVVAGNIAPNRRVRFGRHPDTEATPDAVCLPAWMSKSRLLP